MPKPLEFATTEQVWQALAPLVKPGRPVQYSIELAIGCVLAEPARAVGPYPPFDRAAMDGYAVRCGDFIDGKAELLVSGLVRAGGQRLEPLTAGACVQINTGAPVPPGADAVVPVEHSAPLDGNRVRLNDDPRPGLNIQPKASLLEDGQELLPRGTRITPGAAAALAAAGLDGVRVHHAARVGLATCGDELIPFEESPGPGQIRDSNRVILEALIADSAAEAVLLGIAPDEPQQLRSMLELGLHNDILCVVGGMSKGTHDLVPSILEQLGVSWIVTSLNLKPGKPTRIGRTAAGRWVVGLPGNPVSAAVCFLLFVRPLIAALQGEGFRPPPRLTGRVAGALPASTGRPMYQPACWEVTPDGENRITLITWRGSGDPFGLAQANALLERPEAATPDGAAVRFVPFGAPR